jgi:hypothetical protein
MKAGPVSPILADFARDMLLHCVFPSSVNGVIPI